MGLKLNSNLKEQIDKLPDLPGVYLFKNSSGSIIYVGKAKSIKKRVRNHFTKPVDPRHEAMLADVKEIDHLVTANEIEALLLEYNLIKKHRPKYNVLYRDDKSYPYLAVTVKDEWPRLILTRNLNLEGARYFGPYPKASAAREVLNSLLKLFPLRTCRGNVPGKKGQSPCLMFHLKKCAGPCVGAADREEYMKHVDEVIRFLSGENEKVIAELERKMLEAAEKLEFEKAAAYREKLLAARYVASQQRVVLEEKIDADVVGYYSPFNSSDSYVRILQVRSGKIIGAYGYGFSGLGYEQAVKESLYLFYTQNQNLPSEILLPIAVSVETMEELALFLRTLAKKNVEILVPKRGRKKELLKVAAENAASYYFWFKFQTKATLERSQQALEELAQILELKRIPLLIESYDMSGFREENPVGTMVVFVDGQPNKNLYRKFRIKSGSESDYHKMLEVLKRRLTKIGVSKDKAFNRKPDLIILDGGKAQLAAAVKAIKEIGKEDLLNEIDVIAIAKPEDHIYTLRRNTPVVLPPGSEALKLVQRIRDEAHRTAAGYFRLLEERRIKMSILDSIKGIGPQRKKKLLNYFGNLEKIKKASLFELQKVVPKDVALKIKEVLNSQ
jgi:excinuclease ABC subunit C